MTGDGVNDAMTLKKVNIGIVATNETYATQSASNIILTNPGLSVIISVLLTSRAIFQCMNNYTICGVSMTICIVLGFIFLALIWKIDFPSFMVLILAILNEGTIMTISKYKVKPSPLSDSWNLSKNFSTWVIIGSDLTMMITIFFGVTFKTKKFLRTFVVSNLHIPSEQDTQKLKCYSVSSSYHYKLGSHICNSILKLVFCRVSWHVSRNCTFSIAQLSEKLIASYLDLDFASIRSIGWVCIRVIWIYNIIFYFPHDLIKFAIWYAISGREWDLLVQQRVSLTTQKNLGREVIEIIWAHAETTLHELQPSDTKLFGERSSFKEVNQMVEEAKRHVEIASLREINTLKGTLKPYVVDLKGN